VISLSVCQHFGFFVGAVTLDINNLSHSTNTQVHPTLCPPSVTVGCDVTLYCLCLGQYIMGVWYSVGRCLSWSGCCLLGEGEFMAGRVSLV
jgi:hypothetical protein